MLRADGDYLSWIKLSLVFGYGSKRMLKMYRHHLNAENFFYALCFNEEYTATEQEILAAKNLPDETIDAILDTCRELDINIYCYESEGYPERLRALANPPAVLYSFGSLDFLNDENAVLQFVGSRTPSEYTKDIMPKLISPLAKLGFGFISGYADGVDRLTNSIARENMAPNAVFLAEPLDKDEKNREIFLELSKGGAVISEFAPGIKTYAPHTYSLRNRVMTCVADALVICQEGEQGKGLDNISYAAAQGKRIYVVPPADIYDPRYFGQRDLLRKGYTPLFSSADIVYGQSRESGNAYDLSVLDASENYLYNPTLPPEKKERKKKPKRVEKNKRYEHKLLTPQMLEDLSEVQRSLVFALDLKPLTADELSMKLNIPAQELINELTELELDDVLSQDVNKNYYLL
ncbi:MAG: DNA-processing protein DprA [Ruminococcus sp.]|nr:DNA-processing protein DprA [Ruminococcus sp.]